MAIDKKFMNIPEKISSIEAKIEAIDMTGGVSGQSKVPHPAQPYFKKISDNAKVFSADEHGSIYGIDTNSAGRLLKSSDDWETTEEVWYAGTTIWNVLAPKSGRLVASADDKLFVSDENQENFVEVHQFPNAGKVTSEHAWDVYNDIILVGSYGPGITGQVVASFNGGETWETILDLEKDGYVVNREHNAHVHAVAYDAYTGRIYVSTGDADNTAHLYSDDFGRKWVNYYRDKMAWEVSGFGPTQVTGIQAFPNVVAFHSDGEPEGVWLYKKQDEYIQGSFSYENKDLIIPFKRFYNDDDFNESYVQTIAGNGVNIELEDERVYVVNYRPVGTPRGDFEMTYLLASVNGVDWFVIYAYREPGEISRLKDVVLKKETETTAKIFVGLEPSTLLVGDLPKFK